MIELEFLSNDPVDVELCRRYWQLAADGTFKESKEELLPLLGFPASVGDLDRAILVSVIARDTRRRCPTCGMPQKVSRECVLAPVTRITSCQDCQNLKQVLARDFWPIAKKHSDDGDPGSCSDLPVASMAILDALSQIAFANELRDGFSASAIETFAPAHLNRFLGKLCATHVIEKVRIPPYVQNAGATSTYRLTNFAAYEKDRGKFREVLANGNIYDYNDLWELWLDYALAECVAFICKQSTLLGLPSDPENPDLCTALRAAVGTYSIGEVWSLSRLAVLEAVGLIEDGCTALDAAETISRNIAWRCRVVSEQHPIPAPITRSIYEPFPALGAWFFRWYGVYLHTRGPDVASVLQARRVVALLE